MPFKKEQVGPDDQTALLNSKPAPVVEETDLAAYFNEWADRTRKVLGISDGRQDVKPDNQTLFNALARIKESGAPDPIIVTEVIYYPPDPSQSFSSDVYVFTHFQNPRLQYRATEYLLAMNPNVVINDLKTAGIRAKQD